MFPKNGGLNLSSQDGYRFVQISPGNRAGGTSLIISASLNVKKEIIGLARQHTAMGLRGSVPVARSWLRVPADSQVALRGRGVHHEVQRLPVAERPTAVCRS